MRPSSWSWPDLSVYTYKICSQSDHNESFNCLHLSKMWPKSECGQDKDKGRMLDPGINRASVIKFRQAHDLPHSSGKRARTSPCQVSMHSSSYGMRLSATDNHSENHIWWGLMWCKINEMVCPFSALAYVSCPSTLSSSSPSIICPFSFSTRPHHPLHPRLQKTQPPSQTNWEEKKSPASLLFFATLKTTPWSWLWFSIPSLSVHVTCSTLSVLFIIHIPHTKQAGAADLCL